MGPILLFAENGVLGSFGYAELHDTLGLDLDGFTGGGIAADTGFAIDQYQLAETWNGECVLGVFVSHLLFAEPTSNTLHQFQNGPKSFAWSCPAMFPVFESSQTYAKFCGQDFHSKVCFHTVFR